MKFRHFASAIAALALAGCSNDDVVLDNNQQEIQEGENSYLAISLVTDGSPISRGSSSGYQEGTDDAENAVNTVGFIFFDANGNNHSHVLYTVANKTISIAKDAEDKDIKSEAIAGLDQNESFDFNDDDEDNADGTNSTDNIEKVANAIITFKNLKDNATPRSVFALLNVSKDQFNTLKTLSKTNILAKSNEDNTGLKFANENYYIMSNSIYEGVNATPISASDFKDSEANAKNSPVSIYVERMAAKVQVNRTENATGNVNMNVQTETATTATETTLTVEMVAWGLSGTNKDSYWFKYVDNWDFKWGMSNYWSNANDHRSYWAEDNDYTTGTYVNYYGWSATESDNLNGVKNDANSLIYKSWEDYTTENNTLQSGDYTYCYENTFDGGLDISKSTNVLILAQFKKDGQQIGENVTWYNYNGVLYDENNYKAEALKYFTGNNDIQVKTVNGDKTTYADLKLDDIIVDYVADGYSILKTADNFTGDLVIMGAGDNGTDKTQTVADLNAALKDITRSVSYKNGMMYYCIPIEHLNNHSTADATHTCTGEYGVVRNHWYQLTVGNITALGKGVYDPEEKIVPNNQEKEFFLAAKLYILSWHIVNQTVEDLNKPIIGQ